MDGLQLGRVGKVATIRLARPPHNFFDLDLLRGIADSLAESDADEAVILTLMNAEGRSFCAGADFSRARGSGAEATALYTEAARIFDRRKPLIAAIGGAAVGGGLGLALAADFRVVSVAARFQANFAAIGLHPGFAVTMTLPGLIGAQKARDLLMTTRSVDGEEAVAMGLADRLFTADTLDAQALVFATSMAANAPLALATIRRALAPPSGEAARAAMAAELLAQQALFVSKDFREGIVAMAQRRAPVFEGR